MLADAASLSLRPVELNHDDIAFLQYTGGTTGLSKGAMLSHRNVIANVLQNEAWLQPALAKEPHVDQLTMVCALPLYHIFALTICGLLGTRIGALNILVPNPRDFAGFVKELSKYKFNIFPAVNTLFNALLNTPGFDQLDFSGLKVIQRRRHGGAESGRGEMAQGHRLPDRRRLRPVRNLAGRDRQSGRQH